MTQYIINHTRHREGHLPCWLPYPYRLWRDKHVYVSRRVLRLQEQKLRLNDVGHIIVLTASP